MKYRTQVSLENVNSSQSEIARLVRSYCSPGARVLDVGCAAGDLGEALTTLGYVVTGIEADPEAASVASGRLHDVQLADVQAVPIPQIVRGTFDAVLFGDVLEHLSNPEEVLRSARDVLSDGGVLVASIPNIAHGSVRLALLQGHWDYTDEGLLDRTHVHFFTLASSTALFRKVGLSVIEVKATVLDVLAGGVSIDEASLPEDIVEWVRDQSGSCDFQYVFVYDLA